jgi:uncharacterized protein (DUF433 family)/DNA-binding transcriptional MerR regulator
MTFSLELASVLSGASVSQLRRWHRTDLLHPEISRQRPMLYSIKDVIALRSFVKLREKVSLQKVRKAMDHLNIDDLTDHPGNYEYGSDGSTVVVRKDDELIDLVKHPGQTVVATLEDIFAPFTNRSGAMVPPFLQPRPHLEVDPRRSGGLPTIAGTRLVYENVAALVRSGEVAYDRVGHYYPGVSPEAVADAVDFDESVRVLRRAA